MSERERLLPLNADPEVVIESAVNEAYENIEHAVDDDDDFDEDEDAIDLRELRLANKSIQWFKRPSVLLISLVTFLLAFASSSGESTRQVIQYKLACNLLANNGVCNPVDTQVLISNFQIVTTISQGIMASVAALKIGFLSDQYGRKPFIIAIACMFTIGKMAKFTVMYNFSTFQFKLMILCDLIASTCGGILSLVAITNCYISDVVEVQQRIHSLGIGFASLFLGLSTGPLVGNLILKLGTRKQDFTTTSFDVSKAISKSDYLPLKFEIFICCLVICYATLILPESRSEKARQKSRTLSITSLNSIENTDNSWLHQLNFLKPLKLLFIPQSLKPRLSKSNLRNQRIAVILLVISECMIASMGIAMGEVFILYGLYKFDWDSTDIGHLLAAACSSKAIALIVLSPIINHKILQNGLGFKVFKKQYDMIDFSMAFVGVSLESVLFVFIGLASSDSIFLLCIVLTCFGSLASPTMNSAILKFYPESKFGELFDALALLKNLCQLIGPFSFLTIYKTSLSKWNKPELIFYVCSGFFGVVAINQLIIKLVLNLNPLTEASDISGSSSSTSSLTNYFATGNPSNSSEITNDDSNSNYTELHRKNSFIYKERNRK